MLLEHHTKLTHTKFCDKICNILSKISVPDIKNQGLVSLTSVIGKMMESIVRVRLVKHMMEHDLLCNPQQVLYPGDHDSADKDWSEILDSGAPIDVIYLDLCTTSSYTGIKLEAYDINGRILGWVKDFLLNRK